MTTLSRFLAQHPTWPEAAAAILAALVLAYLLGEIAARLARATFLSLSGRAEAFDVRSPVVRRPVRLVRAVVVLAAAVLLIPPALKLTGAEISMGLNPTTVIEWFLGTGVRVVLIAVLAFAAVKLVQVAVHRIEAGLASGTGPEAVERGKRARTLGALLRNTIDAIVVGLASLMVLRELGVDIAPILAGAGILGLAVGFGAQSLVRDVISGFFLILEDQLRVGDVAAIDGTGGLVEAINLRTTVLRDLKGVVHVFPNGSIERLSNMTKDFSYAVLDVGVAYKEDTDAVVGVLREVGADLRGDAGFAPWILEPLEVLGLDAFGDSQVTIKIRMRTLPLKQWAVGRELRRRIKKAFDQHRIEIPFPHVSVYFGEASLPWRIDTTGDLPAARPSGGERREPHP